MEYKSREDGTLSLYRPLCICAHAIVLPLYFLAVCGKIALRRKFILFSTQRGCASLPLVKMHALFQHTSVCTLELASRQELCVFRRAAFVARFFA